RLRLDDVAGPNGKEKRPAEVRDFARYDEGWFRRRRGLFLRSDVGNRVKHGEGMEARLNYGNEIRGGAEDREAPGRRSGRAVVVGGHTPGGGTDDLKGRRVRAERFDRDSDAIRPGGADRGLDLREERREARARHRARASRVGRKNFRLPPRIS